MATVSPDIVKVSILGSDSIVLGFHLADYIITDILNNIPASTYVIITDTNIAPLYLPTLTDRFNAHSAEIASSNNTKPARLLTHVISPGELSKSRETKGQIEDYLFANTCTRDTCILALGGGVIGDLIGFVAATFMRGVRFVQIPTTLLAMVDSSIGGKTAIDTPHGKNLIGAFWQPKRIFIDLAFLQTLPEREFVNGMAEVIKTAAIWNEKDFILLEKGVDSIKEAVSTNRAAEPNQGKPVHHIGATIATRTAAQSLLLEVVLASVRVKAYVVTHDERETGLRGLLNFGHTIGHAIEAIVTPKMLHGECVAIGMIKEAEIARNIGHLNGIAVGRLLKVVQAYGLPVSFEDKRVKEHIGDQYCHVDAMMDIMKLDKKNQGEKRAMVVLSAIGKTLEEKATFLPEEVIRKVLSPDMVILPVTESSKGFAQNVTMSTPGSKSISNRALVFAALATGACRLKGLLHSDDTQYMLEALQKLGAAQFEWEDNGETLVVTGGGGNLHVPASDIYVGNAGTASRFLTTVLTLVPTAEGSKRDVTVLTGNARMQQRPIAPLLTALKENGAQIQSLKNEGFLPIAVTPIGGLKGGEINLSASISSQYVSSILICAPYAQETVVLRLTGDTVISQPYIDMTIAMMESFGAKVERLPQNTYRIAKSKYKNPSVYFVESDASSATYPLAIAAITGTTCTIPNIGTSSLQGDAGFAVNVLRPMGCIVTQTATSTTVTGPPIGRLRPLSSIDMETMTDAFLTATVLAAVTFNPEGGENITRITGIANQRVKECNRIAAMVHELTKFGVTASELPDGIQIHGKSIESLKAPAEGVHTYDDHRIAMSFSVLSTVVPKETIIREKKCVDKTWPAWWDDLEHRLGVQLRGIDLGPQHSGVVAGGGSNPVSSDPNATIIIIGMRGAGKTTVGRIIAGILGMKFIDMDVHFESEFKTTIPDFVNTWGWEKFRTNESNLITSMLESSSPFLTGHVLACGGGVVESPSNRELLRQFIQNGGKVIHLVRDIYHTERYLKKDKTRPIYGEDVHLVWARREPWYRQCCNFEFVVYVDSDVSDAEVGADQWKLVERDLRRFLNFVTGRDLNNVSQVASKPTTFVALTYPDLRVGIKDLETITEGADAVELRVDLLKAPGQEGPIPSRAYVGEQLALLRRYTSIPVVFTVRSKSQAGAFPDDAEKEIFDLLSWGEKWGCEYVDVEISLSPQVVAELVARKGNSKIIASWHDVKVQTPWDGALIVEKYKLAEKHGDIIKLIGTALSFEHNLALEAFRTARKASQTKPLIAMNMGPQGQLSRVLNDFLTPTTHPALPNKAAPGQLSLVEIHKARHLLGLLPSKKFYLLGTPIQHSLSPTLHNTGFQTLGLPYEYSLFQCSAIEYAEEIIRVPSFGGASVTIPHKLAVMKYTDEVTEPARIIGAVNTLIVENSSESDEANPKRRIIGDNTDYLGILNTIKSQLADTTAPPQEALVIGAGGTSRAALYALYMLGVSTIYLYNRTTSKASSLIKEFEAYFPITLLETLEGADFNPTIVVSTIPADNNVDWPESLFAGRSDGVVCDLAYKPRRTNLLKAAESKGWKIVEGIQVLIEQGYWQFERWTGKRAPRAKIAREVLAKYDL